MFVLIYMEVSAALNSGPCTVHVCVQLSKKITFRILQRKDLKQSRAGLATIV